MNLSENKELNLFLLLKTCFKFGNIYRIVLSVSDICILVESTLSSCSVYHPELTEARTDHLATYFTEGVFVKMFRVISYNFV